MGYGPAAKTRASLTMANQSTYTTNKSSLIVHNYTLFLSGKGIVGVTGSGNKGM